MLPSPVSLMSFPCTRPAAPEYFSVTETSTNNYIFHVSFILYLMTCLSMFVPLYLPSLTCPATILKKKTTALTEASPFQHQQTMKYFTCTLHGHVFPYSSTLSCLLPGVSFARHTPGCSTKPSLKLTAAQVEAWSF